jgi:hypothetical protein
MAPEARIEFGLVEAAMLELQKALRSFARAAVTTGVLI